MRPQCNLLEISYSVSFAEVRAVLEAWRVRRVRQESDNGCRPNSNHDAVLIDLCTVQQGPLSADPACLEVALMFERRAEKNERGGDDIPFEEWQAICQRLIRAGDIR